MKPGTIGVVSSWPAPAMGNDGPMRTRAAILLAATAGAAALAGVLAVRARRVDRSLLAGLEAGDRLEVTASDGATLVVDILGPDDGPTVVLAHCWGGHVDNWSLVAGPLVERGHRVVRWHQRGHGPSTVGAAGFAIERFGADLAEVLHAVDARDAVVAGHSLGGMTLQAFAIHHPDVAAERTRGLVLVATAAGGLKATPVGRSADSLARIGPYLDRVLASRHGHHLVRATLGKGASHAAVRATRDHFVGTPLSTRHGVLLEVKDMDLRQAGGDISVPTTVVVGSRDPLTPPAMSRGMAATIPDARLVELRGRGHMLPLEAPDEIVEIIVGHTGA